MALILVIVVSAALVVASAVAGYEANTNMSGATTTGVPLPANGGLCYEGDNTVYEGTFNPKNASIYGPANLESWAKESLAYYGQIDMESAESYDGSSNVTPNSNSYLNKIINFSNLTDHIIDKNLSGNGIYYKGY
jgi:hypothetical protein